MRIQLKTGEHVLHEILARDLGADIVIGRSAKVDWSLPKDQKKASSKHATIGREGDLIVLRDLDSTNGTYLNGERITSRILKVGDELRIGQAWVVVADERNVPATDALCLVVRTGPDTGKAYPVKEGLNTIGSATDSDIHLNDPIVSQKHAELHISSDGYTIKDLGSTNGTVLGSTKLPADQDVPIKLKDNLFIAHFGLVLTRGGRIQNRSLLPLAIGGVALLGLVGLVILLIANGVFSGGPKVDLAGLADGSADLPALIKQAEGSTLGDELKRFQEEAEWLDTTQAAVLDLANPLPALGDAPSFTEQEVLAAYEARLAPQRETLVELHALATELEALPPGNAQILSDWQEGGAIDQALAFDCLNASAPTADRTAGSSDYDRLLGVEKFYYFMFVESDTFDLKPPNKTPFEPSIDRLKPLVPFCISAAARGDGIDGDSRLGQGLAAAAAVGKTLQTMVPQRPFRNRDAVLRAAIARYLEIPGVGKKDFEKGFQAVREQVESASPAEVLSLGLPGDPALLPAWSTLTSP